MDQNVNLNLLFSLKALLETRNLTHAANRLGLAQSAMSRHLVQLRNEFKDPLLVREGSSYILTERAKSLRVDLDALLLNISKIYDPSEFNPALCERIFTFAGSDYLAEYMFPDIVDRVLPLASKANISFLSWRANHFKILVDEEVDLMGAIADQLPENIYGKSVGQDRPVCVMAANHPLAEQGELTLNDYSHFQHVHISGASDKDGFVDNYLSRAGMKRNIRIETPYYVSALSIVARSQLLLTIPEHMAAKFMLQFPVCFKPIPFVDHVNQYWLLWHGRVDKDPAHRWFREHVFDVLYHSIHGVAQRGGN
ncbi:LysR family transcriptional regulator [Chromobacterium alticapitis]|uniref:LysR family transcriptional regulator n=1 Tax=Chromobacterium alticapitis TaxID=2073169 RepID=A0A2S5DC50_9NEIS|nr:LysR family transcriptional regulator [Chromobacterium alticapitis]POZ60591.1 LysR family transcriptional regulator [Chromobacterium alticapitis]